MVTLQGLIFAFLKADWKNEDSALKSLGRQITYAYFP
jgi:hypothetical protein